MIRLDSLDVHIDTAPLPYVHRDRLTLVERTDPETGSVTAVHTIPGYMTGMHGLNGIAASEEWVSLRLTGKAMGDRYTDGFSLDTVEELVQRVNEAGLIELTVESLLGGTVRRADPFTDVVTDDLLDVPGALKLLGRTGGGSSHTAGRGDAVTLYRKLPDGEGKLRCYPKATQLATAPHAAFREAYPAAVTSLQGRHRFEVEARTRHATRRLASMPSGIPTVRDVLTSRRHPVSEALDAMLSTWTGQRRTLHTLPTVPDTMNAFLTMPSASIREDSTAMLATLIADLTAGDFDASCEAVRTRYGSKNAHRFFPALRSACEAYRSPESADRHCAAVEVLRTVSGRVRERESE